MYIVLHTRPPLRQYLLDGEFFVGAALAGTLTKVALRFIGLVADEKKQNVRKSAACIQTVHPQDVLPTFLKRDIVYKIKFVFNKDIDMNILIFYLAVE